MWLKYIQLAEKSIYYHLWDCPFFALFYYSAQVLFVSELLIVYNSEILLFIDSSWGHNTDVTKSLSLSGNKLVIKWFLKFSTPPIGKGYLLAKGLSSPVFGRKVNPISTRGQITSTMVLQAPPGFSDLAMALWSYCEHEGWEIHLNATKDCSS